MVIKLVKVPGELYEQARNTDYFCEHLYQKVARGAKIIRVHDVRETVDALKVWNAVDA